MTTTTAICSQRARLHAKVFYGQIVFTTCTFVLGARALFTRHIPFFAWLPALLLLLDSTLAFASLLYLDFTRHNTTSFLRLILSLVVFRSACSIILVAELFLPHSDPSVSIPLSILSVIHSIFNLLSSIQVYNLTNLQPSEEVIFSYGSVYIIFTIAQQLWIPVKWAKYCITIYCGFFGSSMGIFSIQFCYRYLVFSHSKILNYFKGWKIVWFMLAPVLIGVAWSTSAILLCDPDEKTDAFMENPLLLTFDLKIEDIVYLGPHFYKLGDDGKHHFDEYSIISLIFLLCIIGTSFASIIYFGTRCYREMSSIVSHTTSPHLHDLQTQLFHALMMQSMIPIILMHIPTTSLFLFTLFEIDMRSLNSYVAVTIALFPAADPFPTMFIVKDYRNAVLGFFRNPLNRT